MKRINKIIKILNESYPEARCDLIHQNAWELLVSTILSAQATDKSVVKVTPHLFEKYSSIEAFSKLNPSQLERDIKTIGLSKTKSKNIILSAKKIKADYKGKVPQTLDELTSLPGVGRKTANVVLGNFFQIPAIAVDTHVRRLSYRIGLTEHQEPDKIEKDLEKEIPKQHWIVITHLLIRLGRQICTPRNPRCEDCPMTKVCPKRI